MLLFLHTEDILDVVQKSDIKIMHADTLELAITGLTINEENKAAVKRVLVDGLKMSAVAEETGIKQPQISYQVNRVLENLKKVLDHNDLFIPNKALDKELESVIDTLNYMTFRNRKIDIPPKATYQDENDKNELGEEK